MKEKNYTEEQTEYIISEYSSDPTRDTVDRLAEELGKTVKSIIGKLSREKVYIKREYITKTGSKPKTKKEFVQELAEKLEIPYAKLQGLEKAPKNDLKTLIDSI